MNTSSISYIGFIYQYEKYGPLYKFECPNNITAIIEALGFLNSLSVVYWSAVLLYDDSKSDSSH